jgi:predicted acyltransferase (DUF342 family)
MHVNADFDGEVGAWSSAPLRRTAPETAFERAVCICGDFTHAGALTTRAREGAAADVGVLGSFSGATGTNIAGSLLARGTVSVAGDLEVRDDLFAGRGLSGAGDVRAGRDLQCGGDVSMAGSLGVGGTMRVAGHVSIAGEFEASRRGAYATPSAPPCGCADFDVARAVSMARDDNDNEALGLPTDAASLGGRAITLGTGRYYFSNAAAIGRSRFLIDGNVTIHVDGDLDAVGRASFELAPGAACDVYVNGSVRYAGSVVAGDAQDPSAFRLYVGGAGSVVAGAGEATFYGFVYAPRAEVSFAGDTKVVGAVVAKDISYAGSLTVAYAKPSARVEIAKPTVGDPASQPPSDPAPAPLPAPQGTATPDAGSSYPTPAPRGAT